MELVPVVAVLVVVVIATSVCLRRARLGNQMDRSLEQLKSHAGVAATPEVASGDAPMPRVLVRRPSVLGSELAGRQVVTGPRQRVPAAAMVDHHLGSPVPKAS